MLCLSKEELQEIVENGQLNSGELFEERANYFRQALGLNETLIKI